MFFDSVYPIQHVLPTPSISIKFTHYLIGGKINQMVWFLFCFSIQWLAKLDLNITCILRFEIVSTNPPFLSRPSDTKIQTAIIWW